MEIRFTSVGSQDFTSQTCDVACQPPGDPWRRIAIVLDEEIISAPWITDDLPRGVGFPESSMAMTGPFAAEEAQELTSLVGVDPLPLEVVVIGGR